MISGSTTVSLAPAVFAAYAAVVSPVAATTIPLCPGLTIVTAVSQTEGDYESIKTIESADDGGVRLKYSNERAVQDVPGGPTKLRRLSIARVMRVEDVAGAHLYLQQYQAGSPVNVPGATAIGTSSAVLRALKTKGEAKLGIFDLPAGSALSADPDNHPSVFDYQTTSTIRRVGDKPVMLPLTVNGETVELRAIHATGDFAGEKAEFFFLDDEANPLALRFRIGIGQRQAADGSGSDRDTLRVVKISYQCTAPPLGQGRLERALSKVGEPVAVYDIYFSFNSDKIRTESEPTLRELAGVLTRHGDWKLSIDGHTDGVGGEEKNLDLSKRRSAAVKAALVSRYGINAERLATSGYGKARPKDTNDTPEGRARNRRVELIRQP